MICSAMEIDVKFQYRYANQYPKAIRLVANGLIDLKSLVTHRFTLEQSIEAFHVGESKATSPCFLMLIFSESQPRIRLREPSNAR